MSVPTASPALKHESPKKTTLIKLVAFEVGKLTLAVRIDQVEKVVNLPKLYGSGLNPIGLAQVGDREITVLDLAKRLFHAPTVLSLEQQAYLILVKQPQGEVFGIPVTETPLLLDVSTDLIRTLPESYRQADTLAIASHIVVVSTATGSRTLFLLDLNRLTV